jgi:hypothetical protein
VAVLTDNTVTGAGDLDGYQPAPLTLYAIVTQFGNARTHDAQPSGRWFDLGYVTPYFMLNPVGLGDEHYQFDSIFIPFAFTAIRLHQYTGGLDGIHYDLGPGVEVRFLLTDD